MQPKHKPIQIVEIPTKTINIEIPETILNSFNAECHRAGRTSKGVIIEYMRRIGTTGLR